jgi:iron complex outermembrane receptor protein
MTCVQGGRCRRLQGFESIGAVNERRWRLMRAASQEVLLRGLLLRVLSLTSLCHFGFPVFAGLPAFSQYGTFMQHAVVRAVVRALLSAAVVPAFAQTEALDPSPGNETNLVLDEVVVTAQKRETNLQDTPISVSVLTGDALADRHAVSLLSLADGSIPSLRVSAFGTRASALAIGIRGIGAAGDANQPARDQGVGVYVDGVFLGRAQGLGTALYDVERIEALKGPQGTLFGRNTEGGAISIVTRAPSGEFHLDSTFGVADYDGYNGAVHLDLPKMGDFSFKIDGLVTRRDGTTDNPMRGERDFNSYDKRGVRVTGLWQPVETFSATYAYDNSYDATTPIHAQLLVAGPLSSPLQRAGASEHRRDSAILGGAQEENVGKTSGHLLVLDWDVAERLKLKSISSYRDLEQGQFDQALIDAISTYPSSGNLFGRYSLAQFWQYQWSEELQLVGHTDQVQYVAGAFYFKESVGDNAQTPLMNLWTAGGTGYTANPAYAPLDLTKVTVDRASRAWTKSLGLFAQATWTPVSLDRLHLTAGGRYTSDDKNGHLFTLNGASSSLAFDDSWSRFDPMVNVAWDIAEQVMVYAKYSTGFKAGGANSRSLSYRAFGPEEVTAFELGLKSQFWNNRARLNLALFDSKIKNKQMDFYFPFAPGSTRTVSDTTNATTEGTSKGAELEFSIVPATGLTLGLNYAWTDIGALQAPNPYVTGNPLATILPLYAPKKAGSVSVDYRIPFGASAIRFHADGNWSDGFYTSEIEQTRTDKSFVTNARLSLADMSLGNSGATAEFSLWARNLLDEEHLVQKSIQAALGVTYGIFNDPRTYGLEARIRF